MRRNLFDRIAVTIRPFTILLALISLPAFLLSYVTMISMAFDAWPLWAWGVVIISHVIVWIGASMLHDLRLERRREEFR